MGGLRPATRSAGWSARCRGGARRTRHPTRRRFGDDGGIVIHWTPDPDAFDYGIPDTQPADGSDDGGIIIEWTPDPDAFDYGIPDTQPDPGEAGARGIIVYDMPDPAEGAYDGPDIQPGGDSDASGEARGIIIHAAPDPESADVDVQDAAITKVSDAADASVAPNDAAPSESLPIVKITPGGDLTDALKQSDGYNVI